MWVMRLYLQYEGKWDKVIHVVFYNSMQNISIIRIALEFFLCNIQINDLGKLNICLMFHIKVIIFLNNHCFYYVQCFLYAWVER